MHGKVRIIAGRWGRRIIQFNPKIGTRPTTDAARETLFNWLRDDLHHAQCLDLYAGSGALGFEALSRGAKQVVFVDSNLQCIRGLRKTTDELGADNAMIVRARAQRYLECCKLLFNVIFIDPPYRQGLALDTLKWIDQSRCLKAGGVAYIEMERRDDALLPGAPWTVIRSHQSGQRLHALLRFASDY